jgi:hypothetical protein
MAGLDSRLVEALLNVDPEEINRKASPMKNKRRAVALTAALWAALAAGAASVGSFGNGCFGCEFTDGTIVCQGDLPVE